MGEGVYNFKTDQSGESLSQGEFIWEMRDPAEGPKAEPYMIYWSNSKEARMAGLGKMRSNEIKKTVVGDVLVEEVNGSLDFTARVTIL